MNFKLKTFFSSVAFEEKPRSFLDFATAELNEIANLSKKRKHPSDISSQDSKSVMEAPKKLKLTKAESCAILDRSLLCEEKMTDWISVQRINEIRIFVEKCPIKRIETIQFHQRHDFHRSNVCDRWKSYKLKVWIAEKISHQWEHRRFAYRFFCVHWTHVQCVRGRLYCL